MPNTREVDFPYQTPGEDEGKADVSPRHETIQVSVRQVPLNKQGQKLSMSIPDLWFCNSCRRAFEPEEVHHFREEDTNWNGKLCRCGVADDFDQVTAQWLLDVVDRAILHTSSPSRQQELNILRDIIEAEVE